LDLKVFNYLINVFANIHQIFFIRKQTQPDQSSLKIFFNIFSKQNEILSWQDIHKVNDVLIPHDLFISFCLPLTDAGLKSEKQKMNAPLIHGSIHNKWQ